MNSMKLIATIAGRPPNMIKYKISKQCLYSLGCVFGLERTSKR